MEIKDVIRMIDERLYGRRLLLKQGLGFPNNAATRQAVITLHYLKVDILEELEIEKVKIKNK